METLDSIPKNITFGLTGTAEVMQNVQMIITTRKGTLPLDRNFGISFNFLDSPVNTARAKIEQEVFLQIKKYEPRAILKQITWNDDPLAGKIGPNVSIEVVL